MLVKGAPGVTEKMFCKFGMLLYIRIENAYRAQKSTMITIGWSHKWHSAVPL